MSSSIPYLPPVLETVNDLLTNNSIPALDADQMETLSHYLFTSADRPLRIRVAEIAYRNHAHPNALALFLACTMPLAQVWTQRKAERFFVYPSDWQIECLYTGVVNALIAIFQRPVELQPIHDSFRRFLYRSMLKGACREYFRRDENSGIQAVENIDRFSSRNPAVRTAEEELITRDLLEQIYQYPLLRRGLSRTLECIVQIGPDLALRVNKTPEKHRDMKTYKPMLNIEEIAKARGIKPSVVHRELSTARAIIRQGFNGDRRLFMTR